MLDIQNQIAQELGVAAHRVRAAVELLDSGSTVPFIARYRKEQTSGLDDIQLRQLELRLQYLRDLEDRKNAVVGLIAEQGKLSAELERAIWAAPTKQIVEDLYLPFKLKRRTKGQAAKEAGLEPLADLLLANPQLQPEKEALAYLLPPATSGADNDKKDDYSTVPAVLDGVRDLLSERWAQNPALVQLLREWLWAEGQLFSRLLDGKEITQPDVAKFSDYFDYQEPIARVPSHRALAVLRGRSLDVLTVQIVQPESPALSGPSLAEGKIGRAVDWTHQGRAADDFIRKCVAWTWRVKLSLTIERDLLGRLREQAESVAIDVFANNLRDLLLAPPAGTKVVMGLDPGIRTGVKVAVVDATGKLLETATVFPHEPRRDWEGALARLTALCCRHQVNLIAIGNGTASRETDRLAAQVIQQVAAQMPQVALERMVVSEAGASVYSASEFASQEMPDTDVSLRGAASIARRLQDPLAELVKIDPKAIGVGQYQHDVNPVQLARQLDAVVEDCVNGVGVDLNTASVALLRRVSGLGVAVAQSLVRYRDAHGKFNNRQQLLQVPGMGAKTFEQCAGFLRIRGGDNPLDMTGVHPETYPVVERILTLTGKDISQVMGRPETIKTLKAKQFTDASFGEVTVSDILAELEKPGRDPRGHFKAARFNEGIEEITDLKPGMVVTGTVSNVAAFGAFVDIGVHQDGLVHVSEMSRQYTQDARTVVRTGDVVQVKVLEVDLPRKRISLSLRLEAQPKGQAGQIPYSPSLARAPNKKERALPGSSRSTAMQAAFAKLKR